MNPSRPAIPLQAGWRFAPAKLSRAGLRGLAHGNMGAICLPHTWNAVDTYLTGRRHRRGWGSYAARLQIDGPYPTGGQWHLVTEGFYGTGDLILNDSRVASIDGQFLGLDVALGNTLHPGENWLGIRLTNACASHSLPGIADPDFILYGGLSGRCLLEWRPPVHILCPEFRTEQHAVLTDDPGLTLTLALGNTRASPCHVRIKCVLSAENGQPVATAIDDVRIDKPVHHASLTLRPGPVQHWSPESPQLYRLDVSVTSDDGTEDRIARTIGFREAVFVHGGGFKLNGRPYPLRGINRHEEVPGYGRALPAAIHQMDAELIRSAGLNFVRLSHYPQSPDFLDACDRVGLLVMPEIASWKSVRAGRWLTAANRQLTAMIQRDRHHPSIILWGMGNESRNRQAYEVMSNTIRSEDPLRPSTYAENHLYRAKRERTVGMPDVWGLNYELKEIPAAREGARLKNLLVTETANHPHASRGDLEREGEQLAGMAAALDTIEAHDKVSGFCLWSYADYATPRKNRFRRLCGIVDAWRSPKLAAAMLAARYHPAPLLTVLGDWSLESTTCDRRFLVVSNGTTPTFRYTGSESGPATATVTPLARHVWAVTIPFRPAPIEFQLQHEGGTLTQVVHPWGPACTLAVTRQEMTGTDGPRHSFIDVVVQDAGGNPCLNWNGMAVLHAAAGTTVHSCFLDNQFPVAAGRGRVFVSRPGEGGGSLLADRVEIAGVGSGPVGRGHRSLY